MKTDHEQISIQRATEFGMGCQHANSFSEGQWHSLEGSPRGDLPWTPGRLAISRQTLLTVGLLSVSRCAGRKRPEKTRERERGRISRHYIVVDGKETKEDGYVSDGLAGW